LEKTGEDLLQYGIEGKEMKQEQETMQVKRVYSQVKNRKSQEVHSDVSDTVEVRTFEGIPTATVSVKAGLTKNLGDYSSATIQVMVSVPTYTEEIDQAFAFAANKVDEYLAPSLEEFVEVLKDKGLLK
jgi:hypothetical protein